MACSELCWWRRTLELFLLLLSLWSGSSSSSLPSQYSQHRLDELCGLKINLGKAPGVFLFSGPPAPDYHLECEVEIRAASPGYGLYVFIEELKLHSAPDCSADFLQFGR